MAVVMNNFRLFALVIGLTIFFVSSGAHAASFIIQLSNGREVSASHVWEEGDEIKFYTPHGTAGIPKTHVKHIKASTTVSHDKVSNTALPVSPADPALSTTDTRSEKHPHTGGSMRREEGKEGKGQASADKPQDGSARLKAGDVQAYHAKKVMLTGQLDEATKKYLEASAARNPDAKKAALDDMRTYSKQIIDVGEEVKQKNGGVLPPGWND